MKRIPFGKDTAKGPQPVGKPSKKAPKVETVIEEPAKIEVIDTITEPVEEAEPVEESTDGNS